MTVQEAASCLSKEDNALLSVCLSFYEKLV